MKISNLTIAVFILLHLIIYKNSFSQENRINEVKNLTDKNRKEVIAKIKEIFTEYYPIPSVSAKMIGYIEGNQDVGNYRETECYEDFTQQLTKDLRKISNDDHIKIYPYEEIPEDLLAETKLGNSENNYGFQKIEILTGNIGYINLTTFNNLKTAGVTAIAAMNFIANTEALIIDLRLNGGGDEAMAQLISSYFFEKSTHLSNNFTYKDSITEQLWTQEWVPGRKFIEKPIYILLSNYSYSSAEAFSYQLQQLKRAKIVGEKTKGGAHGVRYMSFPEININMKVPYSQEINPYSKTNYIAGVIPDIPCVSEQALIVAQIEAAKDLLNSETDSLKKYKLQWIIDANNAEISPVNLDHSQLSEYCGIYQNIIITSECSSLFLKRGDNAKQEMIPLSNDIFKYKDSNEEKYRIKFTRNKSGNVDGLFDFDSDGDQYPIKQRVNE